MSDNISRRKFILTSGILASGLTLGMANESLSQKFSANNKVRLGVIGTGGRGNWEISLIKNIPGIDVVACCDIQPDRLDQGIALAAPNAKKYTDYRKMLDSKDIDAVLIATPLHLHTPMAMAALDAGKHVYCEKTMTYNIEETRALYTKVKDSKLVFQVGYQHRYNPLYQKIYETINGGHIGEITHILCTWNRHGDWRRPVPNPNLEKLINWRLYKEYSGGLMAELSSHQLDIVDWIFNTRIEKVSGFGGVNYWKDGRTTFDNIYTMVEYPNGIKAEYNCLTTNAHEGYSMKFYGTLATIEVSGEQGHRAVIYPEGGKKEQPALVENPTKEKVDGVSGATKIVTERGEAIPIMVKDAATDDTLPTTKAFTSFADCIRENKTPIANVDYGYKSAIAVHMANKAMENGSIETWKSDYNYS